MKRIGEAEIWLKFHVECTECNGTGIVEHPAWRHFFGVYRSTLGFSQADLRLWFSDQGYDSSPPEEVECPGCDGTGKMRIELRLGTIGGGQDE